MTLNKSNKINYEFYAYSWHVDEEFQDETYIRIYGFDEHNENICVSINGFKPFVWVELPTHIDWKMLHNREKLYLYFKQSFPRVKCTLKFYKKLYGANLKKKEDKYVHKLFPFLLCTSSSFKNLKFDLSTKFKVPQRIYGLGNLKFNVHGQDACPRLQFTSKYDLPTAGWIKFYGTEIVNEEDKFTSGTREFMVNLNDKQYEPKELICKSDKSTIPQPLILSFDLEVNSEDNITMPKASRPGDVVFQISCVFSRLGSNKYEKYLLSMGFPTETIVGATILAYKTEKKLLMGFRNLINEKNPNVVTGYNIFNFDIPYLIDRSIHKSIFIEWSQQGFAKNKCGIQREIKWSSSAYKNQEFKFLECEGRLYIDLLPVIQRDFKLNDYKLKTVSTHFIGETKDDLDPKSIFRCYREGTKDNSEKASKYMSICGKYCIQDSMLVMKLVEKLNVWYGLSEMAVVCNVPMITLFTKGQQIKVYSNLYKYCLENKIVPEKDGYIVSENEKYVGAYVFAPKPGLYENVIPMDFCSLYPSLIISYNIDYSTCAFDPTIPDELCHIMEWEDHISCKHDPKVLEKERLTESINQLSSSKKKHDKDLVSNLRKQRSEITKSLNKNVMCEKRRYRFLKTEDHPEFKGVLPSIVQFLLDARKETRKKMNSLKNELKNITDVKVRQEIETTISILNQRQLAYKVSANSMYGITGVKAGLLPFMPVAMSITYMGRKNILKVAEILQNDYGGFLVAGDTDSNYVSFNHKKFTTSELWDYAVKVSNEISSQFPPPMKLEFEEAIYSKFLILTKKRYMYQTVLRDGTIKPEIGKRGVLLNRRDNSGFIRNIYENMIKIIFENSDSIEELKNKVVLNLLDNINLMFNRGVSDDQFIITKSTGDYGDLKPQYFLNEKGIERAMLGQYNVPFLTEDVKQSERITTLQQETDWYLDKLPAHIQLLEKIKRRGHIKNEGSRLEYVIVETDDLKDKQSAKIETVSYYNKNKGILRLDYLYYLNRCINPIDQVLEVVFNLKNFMKYNYTYRLLKKKSIKELDRLFEPSFEIEKNKLYITKNNQDQYRLIYGSNEECLNIIKNLKEEDLITEISYIPSIKGDIYSYLKSKYNESNNGPHKLKTRFIFKDKYIILGNMTESKLISTIKRELK